jgi:hypothetical protein
MLLDVKMEHPSGDGRDSGAEDPLIKRALHPPRPVQLFPSITNLDWTGRQDRRGILLISATLAQQTFEPAPADFQTLAENRSQLRVVGSASLNGDAISHGRQDEHARRCQADPS